MKINRGLNIKVLEEVSARIVRGCMFDLDEFSRICGYLVGSEQFLTVNVYNAHPRSRGMFRAFGLGVRRYMILLIVLFYN